MLILLFVLNLLWLGQSTILRSSPFFSKHAQLKKQGILSGEIYNFHDTMRSMSKLPNIFNVTAKVDMKFFTYELSIRYKSTITGIGHSDGTSTSVSIVIEVVINDQRHFFITPDGVLETKSGFEKSIEVIQTDGATLSTGLYVISQLVL